MVFLLANLNVYINNSHNYILWYIYCTLLKINEIFRDLDYVFIRWFLLSIKYFSVFVYKKGSINNFKTNVENILIQTEICLLIAKRNR